MKAITLYLQNREAIKKFRDLMVAENSCDQLNKLIIVCNTEMKALETNIGEEIKKDVNAVKELFLFLDYSSKEHSFGAKK